MVAGGCAHSALGVAVDREPFDVDDAPSDTLVRLVLSPYAERQGVAHELVGIEASDAVSEDDGGEVHQVYEGVALVELLALQHAANEALGGGTISRGVFSAGLVYLARGGDAGDFFQRLGG